MQSAAVPAATTSFFDSVVQKFVAASAAQVQKLGWRQLFNRYDSDGSGELDPAEFIQVTTPSQKLRESEYEVSKKFAIKQLKATEGHRWKESDKQVSPVVEFLRKLDIHSKNTA